MSFLYPEFIYLMLPVLLILFGLLLTQSDLQERIFAPEALKKLRVDSKRLTQKVRNFFYFLMFLFIILALAAPVVEIGRAKVDVKDDLYWIALDISASVHQEAYDQSRIVLGKEKISDLLQKETRDRIGLLAFAEKSYLIAPPSFDYKQLVFLLEGVNNSDIKQQEANILTLLQAVEKLSKEKERHLLIVTDADEKGRFSDEIAYAKRHKITVDILVIGVHADHYVSSSGELSIALLAKESGGTVSTMNDMSALLRSRAEKSAEEGVQTIYVHLFVIPIGLAMLMLIFATSSFHRGEKYHLPIVLLLCLITFNTQPLKADLFDYQRLQEAAAAYHQEDYRKSAKVFKAYALKYESVEAAYNAANSYYRLGEYRMAAGMYESIYFVEVEKNHRLYHNLGNALAKIGTREAMQKAREAYKKALRFADDPQSRENLNRVEKALFNWKAYQKIYGKRQTIVADLKNDEKYNNQSVQEGKGESKKKMVPNYIPPMRDEQVKKWSGMLQQHHKTKLYPLSVTTPDGNIDGIKPD